MTTLPSESSGLPGEGPDAHSPPIWPCSGWGLTAAALPRSAVSSYLTISTLSHGVGRCVSVSLSVFAARLDGEPWALPSTLPGGARTFLSAEAQRPPSPPTLPPPMYHVSPPNRQRCERTSLLERSRPLRSLTQSGEKEGNARSYREEASARSHARQTLVEKNYPE